jgi:hypothetical protein
MIIWFLVVPSGVLSLFPGQATKFGCCSECSRPLAAPYTNRPLPVLTAYQQGTREHWEQAYS